MSKNTPKRYLGVTGDEGLQEFFIFQGALQDHQQKLFREITALNLVLVIEDESVSSQVKAAGRL